MGYTITRNGFKNTVKQQPVEGETSEEISNDGKPSNLSRPALMNRGTDA